MKTITKPIRIFDTSDKGIFEVMQQFLNAIGAENVQYIQLTDLITENVQTDVDTATLREYYHVLGVDYLIRYKLKMDAGEYEGFFPVVIPPKQDSVQGIYELNEVKLAARKEAERFITPARKISLKTGRLNVDEQDAYIQIGHPTEIEV